MSACRFAGSSTKTSGRMRRQVPLANREPVSGPRYDTHSGIIHAAARLHRDEEIGSDKPVLSNRGIARRCVRVRARAQREP